jgi:S1-C subfamily serine protease
MNRRSVSKFKFIAFPRRLSLKGGLVCQRFLGASLVCSLLLIPVSLQANVQPEQTTTNQPSLATKVAEAIQSVSKTQSSAVVRIRCQDEHGEIVGTGFTIDPTGTIITLAGIVSGTHEIAVEQNGKMFLAQLMAIDQRSGTAFLKVTNATASDSFFSPLEGITIPKLTPVIGIGYPREQEATAVLGMITGSKNHEGDSYLCVTHLTASIPFSEGEGGSPVLDLEGHLLGIVIYGNTQLGTCTILPAAAIAQLHRNLLRYGSLNPGWVGVVVEIAAIPEQNSRTRIISVAPGSPAEGGGIHAGDMLLSLGNHMIHTPDDILEASFYLTAGEPLDVTISRDGTTQRLTLHSTAMHPQDATVDTDATTLPLPMVGESTTH